MSSQPPPIPAPQPPPLPSSDSGSNVFQGFARACWLSLVAVAGMLGILGTVVRNASSAGSMRAVVIGLGIACVVVMLLGVLSGIVALFGLRRHGIKGILVPALVGLFLWIFVGSIMAAIAVPSAIRARQRAIEAAKPRTLGPIAHIFAAKRFEDPELGISFDAPPLYEPFPENAKPADCRHGFYYKAPGELNRVLLVRVLPAAVPRQRLKARDLPQGKGLSIATFSWRGVEVDGIRVPQKAGTAEYVTYNIQLPVRPKAIQLGFGGPASAEEDLRDLAQLVLNSFDGPLN